MSLDQVAELVKHQLVSRDAFLGGRVTLLQPLKGFRAGLDSVLLGASVQQKTGSLLDLGSGVGTASLVALTHEEGLSAYLVEKDDETAAIAAHNLDANGVADRARVIHLDLSAAGSVRVEHGLPVDHFSSVIANPPFFDGAAGTAPDPRRQAARHMSQAQGLEAWARVAASHAAPGGEVIFIHVANRLSELLSAFGARFGAICVLPLCPRDGMEASRVLVRGIKGSRAPLRLMASRVLHETDGRRFRPEFDAIFRGDARLDW